MPYHAVDSLSERLLRAVYTVYHVDESVYHVGEGRGELCYELVFHVIDCLAEVGERVVEFCLSLPRLYERSVIFLENLARVLIGGGEGLRDKVCSLCLVGARGELFVKLVLADTDPIQSVGEGPGHCADLCRLVRRLNERVYRERVAKRAGYSGGNIAPCRNVLFGGRELCEELCRLRRRVGVPEHGIKGAIRLRRRVRRVSRRRERGI